MNRGRMIAGGFVAIGLIVGLIVGGWLLGSEIKDVRLADRYVRVRGLAQRYVKANMAIWPLSFREAGNNLKATYAKSERDNQAILKFLAAQGIPKTDIVLGQPSVTDTQASAFGGPRPPNRYIVERSITVRSHDVDKVAAAVQKTSELIAQGVVLGGGPRYGASGSVSYRYTELNKIKPEMITQATRAARVAANRFAADSGSKVGIIRQARQGLFTIQSADQASGVSSNGSILKKVRVVTTIEYYLQQ